MKTFYDTIYEWVKTNYGENESKNPSWDIKALADHLTNSDIEPNELNSLTKSMVYGNMEQEYLEQDVEDYSEDNDYKLTQQQIHNVADKIRFSDWYCSINPEDLEYYINEELKKGANNE